MESNKLSQDTDFGPRNENPPNVCNDLADIEAEEVSKECAAPPRRRVREEPTPQVRRERQEQKNARNREYIANMTPEKRVEFRDRRTAQERERRHNMQGEQRARYLEKVHERYRALTPEQRRKIYEARRERERRRAAAPKLPSELHAAPTSDAGGRRSVGGARESDSRFIVELDNGPAITFNKSPIAERRSPAETAIHAVSFPLLVNHADAPRLCDVAAGEDAPVGAPQRKQATLARYGGEALTFLYRGLTYRPGISCTSVLMGDPPPGRRQAIEALDSKVDCRFPSKCP
jgi:hypothetical protein